MDYSAMANALYGQTSSRRKVFVSFYHREDSAYKTSFETSTQSLFINKSVQDNEINTEVSTDYIASVIRQDFIADSSVTVVLVGPNTKHRKHVDWEIGATLDRRTGSRRGGLVGILLPTFPLRPGNQYSYEDIPARLADNVKSGYAQIYTWDQAMVNTVTIKKIIEEAFNRKNTISDKADNSRLQMQRNTN